MVSKVLDYFDRPTEVFFAAYGGNSKKLAELFNDPMHKSLINHPVNTQGNHTSLFFACYGKGTVETVNVLIKNGANVLARDNIGRNLLHFAANSADPAILMALLDKFGVVELIDSASEVTGQTPIHALCYPGSGASPEQKSDNSNVKECFKILLSNSIDPVRALNKEDKKGFTPIMLIKHFAIAELVEIIEAEFPSIDLNSIQVPYNVQDILKYDFYGRTKLLEAAFVGKNDLVESELSKNEDPMQINIQNGRNALQLACCGIADGDTVTLILNDARTNTLVEDHKGRTALHFAANTGRSDTVSALFCDKDVRENINIKDDDDRTALHALAMASSRTKPIDGTIISEREIVIELLFKSGIDFNAVDINGDTALEIARELGNIVVVNKIEECIRAAARQSLVSPGPRWLLAFEDAIRETEPLESSSAAVASSSVDDSLKDDHSVEQGSKYNNPSPPF